MSRHEKVALGVLLALPLSMGPNDLGCDGPEPPPEGNIPAAPSNLAVRTSHWPCPDPSDQMPPLPLPPAGVHLTWTDNSNNEYAFLVERRSATLPIGADPPFELIAEVPTGQQYYDDTISPDEEPVWNLGYTYRVKAMGLTGESEPSDLVSITPLKPTLRDPSNVTAVADSDSQVTLTWQDNACWEEEYVIWQADPTDPMGVPQLVDVVDPDTESYAVTGLAPGMTHWFRVEAQSGLFHPAPSAWVPATTWPPGSEATHPPVLSYEPLDEDGKYTLVWEFHWLPPVLPDDKFVLQYDYYENFPAPGEQEAYPFDVLGFDPQNPTPLYEISVEPLSEELGITTYWRAKAVFSDGQETPWSNVVGVYVPAP